MYCNVNINNEFYKMNINNGWYQMQINNVRVLQDENKQYTEHTTMNAILKQDAHKNKECTRLAKNNMGGGGSVYKTI